MYEFGKGIIKLSAIEHEKIKKEVHSILIAGEEIIQGFNTIRDQTIFTNKRAIMVDVKGMTGSKKEFTSVPWSKVQAFSIETSGTFDRDCEIELFISVIGPVRFDISGGFDIVTFNRILSASILV